MAKVTSSARPASRQSQSAPRDAPARVTRATRSQSRDVSEPPGGGGDETPSRKRARKPRGVAAAHDLSTVSENAAIEAQLQAEVLAAEQEAAVAAAVTTDDLEDARRASGNSGFSGTTAKTSFSQEEIADLDADVMVDVLPNLAAAAEQLTRLLVPPNPEQRPIVWKEIRIAGSKHSKLFHNRLASLNVHKASFGSQAYIQPSIVLRALVGVQHASDVPAGPWRPDNLLYKINLVEALRAVLVDIADPSEITTETYQALELLETYFPSAVAGPDFDMEAVRTCLAIQTQLAIMRLEVSASAPTFNPSDIIVDTFFVRNANGDLVYKYDDALALDQMDPDDSTIQETIDGLESLLEGSGGHIEVALGALRAAFPWDRFVDQIVHYYEVRRAQLDQEIAAVGGADAILSNLASVVEEREAGNLADIQRQSVPSVVSTPKKGGVKNRIAQLRAREKRLSEGTAPPQSAPAPVVQMMDPLLTEPPASATEPIQYGWTEDEGGAPAQPTAQERAQITLEQLSGFQNIQRHNATKGKQRSFVDRQDNAQRLNFDDSQQTSQSASGESAGGHLLGRSFAPDSDHVATAPSTAKRPYAVMSDEPEDFEPTQDEGFQADLRDTTAADERRRMVSVSRPPRSRSRPATMVDYELPRSAPSTSPASRTPKKPRKNPGSTIPTLPPLGPDEPLVPFSDYQRAKAQAKQARVTASQYKPPQVRMPWSPEEENALIELIINHGGEGVSYAALKKQDDIDEQHLLRRSAEDMRFKARNMKQTFLLAQVPLPQNWEHVILDKKAIDKLHERGIEYHQERVRGGLGDAINRYAGE